MVENKVHVIGVERESAVEKDGGILGTAAMDQLEATEDTNVLKVTLLWHIDIFESPVKYNHYLCKML